MVDKLIKFQELYVSNKIKSLKPCTILKKYNNLDVSTPIVKNILNNTFESGYDMDNVVCMFDNLFLASTKKKNDGLFHLSVHVSKWVKKLEKISVNSTFGYVYTSDIFSNDIKVIIKMPKNKRDYNDMIKEYFIGVSYINKLRYIVPNFVYTFGAFISPFNDNKVSTDNNTSIPFVIFENIPGNNMQIMLENNMLTFSQYLGMFIQVLLALEVAQREISFTHFDFHTANLMCRTIKKECKYNVPLDNKTYEVTAFDFLPVIIDFGLSTVKNEDGVVVGSYTFSEHGMKHYMISGVDMFKFLYYSCYYSKGNLQRQILNLLSFYGNDDPYKILVHGEKAINKAVNEYVKKGSYSRVSNYTPLEFLDWLLDNPEYVDITSKYIKKTDRTVYVPLYFSTIIQEHYTCDNDTVGNNIEGYIMIMYSIYMLTGYNKKLNSVKLSEYLYKLTTHVTKYYDKNVRRDNELLAGYKKLETPNVMKINDDSKRILNIKINSKKLINSRNSILKLIERYYYNSSFFKHIMPYLQFMYTIKELELDDVYTDFMNGFLGSFQYKIYNKYIMLITKTSRWCQTLLDIINSNN